MGTGEQPGAASWSRVSWLARRDKFRSIFCLLAKKNELKSLNSCLGLLGFAISLALADLSADSVSELSPLLTFSLLQSEVEVNISPLESFLTLTFSVAIPRKAEKT